MSLEEFQSKIYAHGSADHHVLGLKVLEKLREYLKQNFDNL
ncbi:MAG: hypothetical protein Q9M39_04025 [Sulfurovum sp.]|nr:hypothetical protein [Sulfurovum sp.]